MSLHRWILGVDAREHSRGAIVFATWLRDHVTPRPVLEPVHVLEHEESMVLLRRMHLVDLLAQRRQQAATAVREAGDDELARDLDVVQAQTADAHLAELARAHDAAGLVIGRSARRTDAALVRLGRVARRLARALPRPVAVVPPDLGPDDLGDGPIVCAVTPAVASEQAVRRAIELGAATRRPVQLVHAVHLPEPLPADGRAGPHDELVRLVLDDATRRLARWCRAHGFDDVPCEVVPGSAARVLMHRAQHLRAPMLVCGSRRLDLAQRAFTSSLGTHLACHCPLPVLIVPPI